MSKIFRTGLRRGESQLQAIGFRVKSAAKEGTARGPQVDLKRDRAPAAPLRAGGPQQFRT